ENVSVGRNCRINVASRQRFQGCHRLVLDGNERNVLFAQGGEQCGRTPRFGTWLFGMSESQRDVRGRSGGRFRSRARFGNSRGGSDGPAAEGVAVEGVAVRRVAATTPRTNCDEQRKK